MIELLWPNSLSRSDLARLPFDFSQRFRGTSQTEYTHVCSPCHIGRSKCQLGVAAQVRRRQAVMSAQRESQSSLDVSLHKRPVEWIA